MHCLVYIVLDNFFTRVLNVAESDQPCLIHTSGQVLDANEAAMNLGVVAGMSLTEAKILVQGKGIVAWDEETYRNAQCEWLDVCAEFTDVIEPVDQNSAFLDLSAHPNPDALTATLIHALNARGWRAKAGTAGARWVAQIAAQRGDPNNLARRTPRRYVSPLPTACLPLPEPYKRRLEFLGYRTIGDVASLDLATLRKQFEEEALEIKRYALGGGDPGVQSLYPPDSRAARFTFDGHPETAECLELGLNAVAQDLGTQLQTADLFGERLDLFIETEEAPSAISRSFAKAFSSPKTILPCLRLMLPNPLPEGIVALRARALELRKADRIQMDLEGQRSKSQRNESAGGAIRHLAKAFGDQAVRMGSQIAESRRVKVLKAWRGVNGWQ